MVSPGEMFKTWSQKCEANPGKWSGYGIRCTWFVTGYGGGVWETDFRELPSFCESPDLVGKRRGGVQVELSAEALNGILCGALNPQQAFLNGDVKLAGALDEVLVLNLLLEQIRTEGMLERISKQCSEKREN